MVGVERAIMDQQDLADLAAGHLDRPAFKKIKDRVHVLDIAFCDGVGRPAS